MRIYLDRNFLISCLLSIGLSGCVSSPFSGRQQQKSNIWVTAKVEPTARKESQQYKASTKDSNNQPSNYIKPTKVSPSGEAGDLWKRITQDFQIPIPEDSPAIQEQIAWFQQHQGYLNSTAKHAAPYMYLVYEQTQQRNLPAEVVLLPIIESAYYPLAYSGAGAAGLWQLMPGTASRFGLKRNWWYDGRRDIFASTNAALGYLSYLQHYFNGNWLLALAAYDAGEGTIQAAIRRNELAGKDTDFWSLKLPQETMIYVPRMLALAAIIKNPQAYNLSLPPVGDQPYLGKVDVGSQIKLADAARLANMSLSELKQLNPGYSRWSTVPNGPSHLLLPLDKIESFKEKLSTLPRVRQTSWGRYKIQRGDTLEQIAARYNTSSKLIQRVNRLKNSRSLPHGKVLLVPAVSHAIAQAPLKDAATELSSSTMDANKITATVAQTSNVQQAKPQIKITHLADSSFQDADQLANEDFNPAITTLTHTIKSGETLSHIAKRNHVSIQQLKTWNHIMADKALKPGMKLLIKPSSAHLNPGLSLKATPSSKRYYTVRNGDNLFKIARKTGISVAELKRLNQLGSNAIKPGMTLKLP